MKPKSIIITLAVGIIANFIFQKIVNKTGA